MKCPKCKREFHTDNWETAGKVALGLGVAVTGFMLAGPIGAAVGGGLVGKMAQSAASRGGKMAGKEIAKYTCPYCGHRFLYS